MAEGGLVINDDGSWLLSGEVDFDTVPAMLSHQGAALGKGSHIRVDLSDVSRVDSAGLALMIAWLRDAERAGARISFEHVPEQLQSIARVCGLSDILFP